MFSLLKIQRRTVYLDTECCLLSVGRQEVVPLLESDTKTLVVNDVTVMQRVESLSRHLSQIGRDFAHFRLLPRNRLFGNLIELDLDDRVLNVIDLVLILLGCDDLRKQRTTHGARRTITDEDTITNHVDVETTTLASVVVQRVRLVIGVRFLLTTVLNTPKRCLQHVMEHNTTTTHHTYYR